MEEQFNPIAQTRANYYTPGSPVHFVRVELLKGNVGGEYAVCLSFKNLQEQAITGLDILFKCKGQDGKLLCEDTFSYADLLVQRGEMFGADEAIFVSAEAITSVDVVLQKVTTTERVIRLESVKRVRLSAPRRLPADLQLRLEGRMDRRGLKFAPQVLDAGWYCACGAFHPKEEETVYCSECRCDRILLQNSLNDLMQPDSAAQKDVTTEEPTRVVGAAVPATTPTPSRMQEEGIRSFDANEQKMTASYAAEPEEDGEDSPEERTAENVIRWVPPLAAVVCAAIALSGFVYCQIFLS